MRSIQQQARIYVAGHHGLVGSAILEALRAEGFSNLLTTSSQELDLRDQRRVREFFERERPEYVFVAAAKVGGILANQSRPADFIYDNLQIETNIIHSAYLSGVTKLLFLGSTCIYPKLAPQPLKEEYLLSGPLEPTNEWYAIAKIAGIKLCQAYQQQYGCRFISALPTNLYGPRDNFNIQGSHVLPALIRKFHEGKLDGEQSVTVWGTGRPRREFLHADDCARACLHLMDSYESPDLINIGCGEDIAIADLSELVRGIIGFRGEVNFDTSKPDGTPRKLVDTTRIFATGWRPQINLQDGIAATYRWYLKNFAAVAPLMANKTTAGGRHEGRCESGVRRLDD
jgi:GDP-L-fucose synthase